MSILVILSLRGKVILKGKRITVSGDETNPDIELDSDDSEFVGNKEVRL